MLTGAKAPTASFQVLELHGLHSTTVLVELLRFKCSHHLSRLRQLMARSPLPSIGTSSRKKSKQTLSEIIGLAEDRADEERESLQEHAPLGCVSPGEPLSFLQRRLMPVPMSFSDRCLSLRGQSLKVLTCLSVEDSAATATSDPV